MALVLLVSIRMHSLLLMPKPGLNFGLVKTFVTHYHIFIGFGTKLNRQIMGIPMSTNCASLVADLFPFCFKISFMTSVPKDTQ